MFTSLDKSFRFKPFSHPLDFSRQFQDNLYYNVSYIDILPLTNTMVLFITPAFDISRQFQDNLYYNVSYIDIGLLTNTMVLFITPAEAQKRLAKNVRVKRLSMNLTQAGLADRSGVPLSTIRKFEQKGTISLESFLQLHLVLGGLEEILKTTESSQTSAFASIDDVLNTYNTPVRKRGRRK